MRDLVAPLLLSKDVEEIFALPNVMQAMVQFEIALAKAEGSCGVISPEIAKEIGQKADAAALDAAAIADATRSAGNPAIPFVKALMAQIGGEAGGYVHWGATSQDVIDTSLILLIKQAYAKLDEDLTASIKACRALAEQHRASLMIGRTLMQQALPITFGLKCAGWLSQLHKARTELRGAVREGFCLQFGGASGTLASLGDKGLAVSEELAKELDLPVPPLPWHSGRGDFAAFAAKLAVLAGVMGKIARDIALLMQTEIGEVFEPAGAHKGGSSAMPHKRNPVGCPAILANAGKIQAGASVLMGHMVQEHERGVGGWHGEWMPLQEILSHSGGALTHLREMLEGLEVDTDQMRRNLDKTNGLIMAERVTLALARKIGKGKAKEHITQMCKSVVSSGESLKDVLRDDELVGAHLDETMLEELFALEGYLGSADQYITRALAAYQA